ncbi:MobQ family relaxase [Sphingomonas sp. PB2P19]|uniref:MobQ family relaxase n=1 Tax=Sphingomonas rhamnosi TaxID=3096156 RepID=UPI002FCA183E
MSVKTIGRSQGRSATAACAYRSGARIVDEKTGQVFDYSRRGGVERPQCAIFAPNDAPAWVRDRPALWNAVEAAEVRKNSTVAREFEIALPADLDSKARQELVAQFATALVERHGMVVDASIHSPDADAAKGQGNRNHHAHVLCSTRRIEPDGFGAKVRELDNQRSGEVEHWRENFAAMCGDALERAGLPEQAARWRAGHMHKAGQLEAARARGDTAFIAENEARMPGKHFGPNIIQMERKGVETVRGEKAREPVRANAEVIDLAEARARIEGERQAEPERRGGLLDAARAASRGSSIRMLDTPGAPAAPATPAARAPELVLREWRTENDRQFAGVVAKAEKVDDYARRLLAGHERRQEAHRLQRPEVPTGLFASVKRGAYEAASKAWEQTRAAIGKRIERLGEQIDRLAGYMRRAFPWEGNQSPGERLAERLATRARPALAAEVQAARETGMAAIDGTTSANEQRQAETRAIAERDGRLAAQQDRTLAEPSQAPTLDGRTISDRMAGKTDAAGKPPQTEQEKRVAEAREKIRASREKERQEREQGKDRGRGR